MTFSPVMRERGERHARQISTLHRPPLDPGQHSLCSTVQLLVGSPSSSQTPETEMTMKRFATSVAVVALFPLGLAATTSASAQTLESFGVLGASTVTNTGPSVIEGNVGVWAGTAVTGFPPGSVTNPFTIYADGPVAQAAQERLDERVLELQAEGLSGMLATELGGLTILPGVYEFTVGTAGISAGAELTLDAQGDPNAIFIFRTDTTLITGAAASVRLVNGAQGNNVYWVVGSSATLGANTEFVGRILAAASITLITGANIQCGAAWAQTAAVILDTNNITAVCAFQGFDDAVGDDVTPTGEEVAGGIDDFIDEGGDLPVAFQDLLDLVDDLTSEEVVALFSQLAGETATGVAPTATQSMNSFLSMMLNTGTRPGSQRSDPKVATVKALGYADLSGASPAGSAALTLGESAAAFEPGTYDIWAGAFGSNTRSDGDSGDGTHDRSSRVSGIGGGVDFNVDYATRIGIAFSGGSTGFRFSDDLGGGKSDVLQAAIYARKQIDEAYVLGALAYGYHDVSTSRTVTLPPPSTFTENLSAKFSAHNVAAQVEAGYRFGWITPYGAARLQSVHTPAYSENSNSLSDGFALDYASNTATNVRTELGARMEHVFALDDGASVALHSRIAWAHDFWSGHDGQASFRYLPGSDSFTVRGNTGARDSLLLSAGTELSFGNGFAIAGWMDGELADGSKTFGGNVKVSYSW